MLSHHLRRAAVNIILHAVPLGVGGTIYSPYKVKGLSQVVGLIGMLLVFASQKIVHNVQNEMAESIVPLRKKIKDSLTRQGM